jgi:hypothetical protein
MAVCGSGTDRSCVQTGQSGWVTRCRGATIGFAIGKKDTPLKLERAVAVTPLQPLQKEPEQKTDKQDCSSNH